MRNWSTIGKMRALAVAALCLVAVAGWVLVWLLTTPNAAKTIGAAQQRLEINWQIEAARLDSLAQQATSSPTLYNLLLNQPEAAARNVLSAYREAVQRPLSATTDLIALVQPSGIARLVDLSPATTAPAVGNNDITGNGKRTTYAPAAGISVADIPLVAAALNGTFGKGITTLDGQQWWLTAVPVANPANATPGAVVIGQRVDHTALARWQQVAGMPIALHTSATPGNNDWRSWLRPLDASLPGASRTRTIAVPGDNLWITLTLPPLWASFEDDWQPWLVAGVILLLALLLWLDEIARRSLQSLPALVRTTADLAEGRTPPPIAIPPNAELGQMAEYLNRITATMEEREKALKEAVQQLSTLQEYAVDGFFLFDRSGRVKEANAKALDLTGLSRETLLTRDIITCVVPDSQVQEEVYHHFMACLGGEPQVFETRLLHKDGHDTPVEISIGLIADLTPPVVQALVRDISARKRMEHQLIQAEKMEGIGTLAGGIAHDFNNILGGILGYAALIKGMVPEEDRLYRYTDIIERSATRASELTQQLLGYARGGKTHVKQIHPNEIVEEVLALMREDLAQHDLQIEIRLEDSLPAIEGDAGQIHQVLMNLCVNARDAMDQGGVLKVVTDTVSYAAGDAACPPGLPAGRYVRLTVTDSGHGMDAATQKKIFEPFFTTKEPGSGTGLGLAMVYGIVKNHGGQISVSSRVGKGTTMRLYLPVVDAPHPVLAPESPPSPPVAARKEVIMVVDDEETLLELAKEILTRDNYEVILAPNGEEALKEYSYRGHEIALVVLDIVMPGMGGKETYKQLLAKNPQVKVVVSSGFSRHGQAHDLLEMGADAFIQKPYRPDEFVAVIREVLTPPSDHSDDQPERMQLA